KDFFIVWQGALKDANNKFPAYFWECPPVSRQTINKPFEFVITKSEDLNNISQDYTNFVDYLAKGFNKNIAHSFPNKNKDAILIIPGLKVGSNKLQLDYKNISQFTKNAPQEQQQALWQEVANKLAEEINSGEYKEENSPNFPNNPNPNEPHQDNPPPPQNPPGDRPDNNKSPNPSEGSTSSPKN
ncbi:3567_t:CDS:2, partial [Ambispora gerdemannii]